MLYCRARRAGSLGRGLKERKKKQKGRTKSFHHFQKGENLIRLLNTYVLYMSFTYGTNLRGRGRGVSSNFCRIWKCERQRALTDYTLSIGQVGGPPLTSQSQSQSQMVFTYYWHPAPLFISQSRFAPLLSHLIIFPTVSLYIHTHTHTHTHTLLNVGRPCYLHVRRVMYGVLSLCGMILIKL